MGELEAGLLQEHGFQVAIDHPYQHYQFAGWADVLAWTVDPPTLLHIGNRTRFPNLQDAAGGYNAKRRYLAGALAKQLGLAGFFSETHVMAGLWSGELIHSVRLRPATFRALCPDGDERVAAWLNGDPPLRGNSSSFVLIDPIATGRQARMTDLQHALSSARPRVRGYAAAAARMVRSGR